MRTFRKKIRRILLQRTESRYRAGYIFFVRSGGLYKYKASLNAEYQRQKLDIEQIGGPKVYCHLTSADLLLNTNDYYYQYILNSSDTIKKISSSFYSGKSFSLPLPKAWIYFLKLNGYKINLVGSQILFLKALVFLFFINLVKCLIHIFRGRYTLMTSDCKQSRSAFVFGMTPNSVSTIEECNKKFTYTNWIFDNMYIDKIYCDVKLPKDEKLVYLQAPVAFENRFNWFSNLMLTAFYAIKISINNSKLIVPNIINFSGLFILVALNDHKSKIAIKYYIYTNSFGVFKPIWCQDRLSHNEFVLTLPYSAPISLISPFDPNPINLPPRSDSSELFLSSKIDHGLFRSKLVDELPFNIFFVDSKDEIPPQANPTIAVFDYEAPLGHFGTNTLNEYGYFDVQVAIKFLTDIIEVSQECGLKVLHKVKRDNLLTRRNEYQLFLTQLSSMDEGVYEAVDSHISPIKLMENSNGIISLPISSPSFIAKSLGYNSIFYDPTSCIKTTDPIFQIVDLISGKRMLKNYIERNFTFS